LASICFWLATGRHGLRDRLKKLGYALPQEELNRTYQRFLTVADKKQEVFDEDLIAILHFDDGQQFLVAVGES
jgi:isopropylmalate/homocitrate/citramalate synthase